MRSKLSFELPNKDRLLTEFEKICEQVGPEALLDVKQDSPLVLSVDRILQHGLRDPVRGYWSLVRSITHSTTLKALEAFVKYISSSQQKGLAWTFYTMEEGSLEYYLSSLLQDTKTMNRHYLDQSLLRDTDLAQRVVTAVTTLRANASAIQASMESSLLSETPLDQPPSLTSPVDSGVALIDSDTSTENEEYARNQQNQGWRVFGSSITTQVSTSSDNTLADDSTNGNRNQTELPKTSIMAQNNKHDGVCRRPRKKKKSEAGKRVSFHQDSNDEDNAVTLRQPANINNFYVEGRYSWAGEGDSFFIKEKENFRQVKSEIYERKGLSSSVSIFESELGIEADCDSSTTTLDDAKHNIEIVCEKLTNVVKQSLGLKPKEKSEDQSISETPKRTGEPKYFHIAERGVPEGQEDPRVFSDYERLLSVQQRNLATIRSSVDLTSDSEWSVDTPDGHAKKRFIKYPGSQRSTPGQPSWPSRVLHEAPSKTSLVKRFLRSIPTRKPQKEKKSIPKPNLYIKGVKPDPELSHDILKDLKEEMKLSQKVNIKEDDEIVTDAMKVALQNTVLMSNQEKIYKVYRVASTEGEPLLAVLTDTALYMTGLTADNTYCRRQHISYRTLDTVVVGPEYQTVMLITVDHSLTVTVISALGQALVTHMVTHLALAVLRAVNSHLSVRLLSLTSMQALYKAILTQSSVSKDETLHYYRYIRVEDSYMMGPCSLSRCGHLMYRSHSHSPWLPGYVMLKGGLLYVYSDANHTSPSHVLSLHRGYFGGCRRVFNSNRPHTFEVLPFGQRGLVGTFQFAAADDYECSDWLQAFIQASSALSQSQRTTEEPLVGCGLLLTSHHLLTLDFPDKVLSFVRLQDISAIRTATTCCILETSCREVQGGGADWILYFLTDQAISEFLDSLYLLKPELEQAVVDVWECEALRQHCLQTSQLVRTAWDPLLRPSCVKQEIR